MEVILRQAVEKLGHPGDIEGPLEDIVAWGPTWFVDQAARALAAYREHLRDAGVRPQDIIREALGQASADPKAGGPAAL